jgi:lantibiotic modifying enzyme
VGAALLRLARAASEHAELGVDAAELAALGEAAFDFERSQFDATAGNWPDLREQAGGTASKPQFVLAYCHGAPGIALSRLSALSLAPGMPARREVEVAVETTLAGRVQKGQTLCHGEIGNMMIVQRAAARLGRADWQQQVDRRLGVTLERLAVRGPECGFDFPAAAPALMNGVAGIGYGLLCLTRPAEVPFVLDLSAVSAR